MEYFENRERAESFGEVARDYDTFRPKYPAALIRAIITVTTAASETGSAPRILDVGSGTGILAAQLRAAGAEVLAVDPDPEMAAVARSKGLEVEVCAFEEWDPQGRSFDLVSFGQSFHWVDPLVALPRIRTVLEPGGTLALAWNDIEPIGELKARLDALVARFHAAGSSANLGTAASQEAAAGQDCTTTADASNNFEPIEHPALAQLRGAGFIPHESTFAEELHYSKDDWLNLVFTYSAQLTMDPVKRAIMREEMAAEIPLGGLNARNRALLIHSEV